MNAFIKFIGTYPIGVRLLIFLGLAAATHLVVILLRRSVAYFTAMHGKRYRKLRSIATLTTSALVFTLYFFAIGLILREFGVSLTAYLASASVLGLAIGFGSQGVVQDAVTGLTFIFSDLVDVGDLVEISGQTGVVKGITMRFMQLENALGASVFIPNRTINNVISYPRGYVRCLVDIVLRGDAQARDQAEKTALRLMQNLRMQFPGIMITAPSSEGRIRLDEGKEILRLKFRIWPNRGQPIETIFCPELISELKATDAGYQNFMVAISYEVEEKDGQVKAVFPWRRGRRS